MKIVGINEYKVYRAVVELVDGSQREFEIDQDSAMLFARELVMEGHYGGAKTVAGTTESSVSGTEPKTPVPGMVQLNPDEQIPDENAEGLYEGMEQEGSVGPEGSESI